MKNYRGNIGFVLNPLEHCTKLDRNTKAKLIHACEALERATKPAGCRNGTVGIPGLTLLRSLLFHFHNNQTGLACPSYDSIQRKTGLCRSSITTAIERLQAIGVLTVKRRLVRKIDANGHAIFAQGSNLYGFKMLADKINLGPIAIIQKMRDFSMRVQQMGTNHPKRITRIERPPLFWMKEGGLRWEPSDDWRTQSRRLVESAVRASRIT